MFSRKIISFFLLTFLSLSIFAQKDSLEIKNLKIEGKLKVVEGEYNALAPAKASFYSAIFPGAGQIYNKKYWKAPIVWGGLATSIYFYLDNNSEYKRYRTAFKLRKAGLQDEFTLDNGQELISESGLQNAQRTLRTNRDLSLLSTVLIYVLQIVEASVNAHLLQFNTSDDLSFEPTFIPDPTFYEAPKVGLTLTYKF